MYQIKSINMENTNLVRKSVSWVILVHNPVRPDPTTNTTSIKTKVFFVPITLLVPLALIFLSLPVTFQYPDWVALFVLLLLEFLKSWGLKKNHSRSSVLITENSAQPLNIQVPLLQKRKFQLLFLFIIQLLGQKASIFSLEI